MEILTIKLGEKKYQAGRFPAYIAREIMRIQGQQNEIAKTQKDLAASQKRLEEIQEAAIAGGNSADIETLVDGLMSVREAVLKLEEDVYDRLLWVICETYNNQFPSDDVERNLDRAEIADQVRRIANATNGIFAKN